MHEENTDKIGTINSRPRHSQRDHNFRNYGGNTYCFVINYKLQGVRQSWDTLYNQFKSNTGWVKGISTD